MPETHADIERTLDRLIARLKVGGTKEARALLMDGRRLLSVVRNWSTIAPTDDARTEMLARVDQLARSVDATVPPEAAPPPQAPSPPPAARVASPERARAPEAERPRIVAQERPRSPMPEPERPRAAAQERPRSPMPERAPSPVGPAPPAARPVDIAVPARSAPPEIEEQTRAAPIDIRAHVDGERAVALSAEAASHAAPMRLRTLPDLDISGVAQLMEDGPNGLDDRLDSGWSPAGRGRAAPDPARARPGSDPARGRRGSDPAGQQRSSSTPPNGRRNADVEVPSLDLDRSGSDRPTRAANRPSRFLTDPDADTDGAGPVYSAAQDEPAPAPRNTMTARASAPPTAAARSDKTLIAVRPLPAPEVVDPRLIFLTDPFSTRADAYRVLRRKLSGASAPKTIAVTSAKPEEGKTSCAANLALAFRETSNERVLLVEANLKAPGLAKLFGFEPPVCFARQMAKNRDSSRASWTVAEQYEPLHVLAVDPSSKTSPILDPIAFANALEQLVEAGYDHIIIDTPPALGGSDVNIIADAVDGIVMVAWIRKSKKSLVKQAIDQLKPATILGVVTLEG